jgi:dihydrofolate reductase
MGKLIVSEFITLDGVVEDPGGAESFERGGWAFRFERGEEGDKFKLDETLGSAAMLLGRKTYEGFAEAWPSRTDPMGFADKMNSMPKYVVSTTLQDPEWTNSTVLGGDPGEAVTKLKADVDGDILVAGSITLSQSLLELGLVDELRLMVFPVMLGAGLRFFAEGSDHAFQLVESKPAGQVLLTTYRPA